MLDSSFFFAYREFTNCVMRMSAAGALLTALFRYSLRTISPRLPALVAFIPRHCGPQ